jgi:hypothetical protein
MGEHLRDDENIYRDNVSGAYVAEYLEGGQDGDWAKLGTYNSWDDALTALVRCRRRGDDR